MIYKNVLTFDANPNVINFTADQISALKGINLANLDGMKFEDIKKLAEATGLTVDQLGKVDFMTALLNWSMFLTLVS
jgi:hypothetical protein